MESSNNDYEYLSIAGPLIKDTDTFINLIRSLRSKTIEEVIESERKYWADFLDNKYFEDKKKLEENEENDQTMTVVKYGKYARENFIQERIDYVLNQKKQYDDMSDEEFEKYIQMTHNERKIAEKIGDFPFGHIGGEMYSAINNVRYMTENEHSFKNHIKSSIKKTMQDETKYGFLIFPSIFGAIGFMNPVETEKLPSAAIIFSLCLSAMVIMNGYRDIKEWFKLVKNNPRDVEILKNAGIYDLVLQQMQFEKEYEEVKKRRG